MVTRNFINHSHLEADEFRNEVDQILLMQHEINLEWIQVKEHADRKIFHPIHKPNRVEYDSTYHQSTSSKSPTKSIKKKQSQPSTSNKQSSKNCHNTTQTISNDKEKLWVTSQLPSAFIGIENMPIEDSRSSHHFLSSEFPEQRPNTPRRKVKPHVFYSSSDVPI